MDSYSRRACPRLLRASKTFASHKQTSARCQHDTVLIQRRLATSTEPRLALSNSNPSNSTLSNSNNHGTGKIENHHNHDEQGRPNMAKESLIRIQSVLKRAAHTHTYTSHKKQITQYTSFTSRSKAKILSEPSFEEAQSVRFPRFSPAAFTATVAPVAPAAAEAAG